MIVHIRLRWHFSAKRSHWMFANPPPPKKNMSILRDLGHFTSFFYFVRFLQRPHQLYQTMVRFLYFDAFHSFSQKLMQRFFLTFLEIGAKFSFPNVFFPATFTRFWISHPKQRKKHLDLNLIFNLYIRSQQSKGQ